MSEQKPGKVWGKPFKKGNPGGPGRPKNKDADPVRLAFLAERRALGKKVADLRLAAKEYTNEALGGLVSVLLNPQSPPGAIVSAASEILDRGWGKPAQVVEGNPDNPVLVKHTRKLDITGLSDEQLDALEQALAQTILTIEHDPNEGGDS